MSAVWPARVVPAALAPAGSGRGASTAVLFDWRGTLVVDARPSSELGRARRSAGSAVRPDHGAVGRDRDPAGAARATTSTRRAWTADADTAPPHLPDGVLAYLGLDPSSSRRSTRWSPTRRGTTSPTTPPRPCTRLRAAGLRHRRRQRHPRRHPAVLRRRRARPTASTSSRSPSSRACRSPIPRCSPAPWPPWASTPDEALMVGDRSRPDGAAVELGIATLLLPPLDDPGERRLHHVTALCGGAWTPVSHIGDNVPRVTPTESPSMAAPTPSHTCTASAPSSATPAATAASPSSSSPTASAPARAPSPGSSRAARTSPSSCSAGCPLRWRAS